MPGLWKSDTYISRLSACGIYLDDAASWCTSKMHWFGMTNAVATSWIRALRRASPRRIRRCYITSGCCAFHKWNYAAGGRMSIHACRRSLLPHLCSRRAGAGQSADMHTENSAADGDPPLTTGVIYSGRDPCATSRPCAVHRDANLAPGRPAGTFGPVPQAETQRPLGHPHRSASTASAA